MKVTVFLDRDSMEQDVIDLSNCQDGDQGASQNHQVAKADQPGREYTNHSVAHQDDHPQEPRERDPASEGMSPCGLLLLSILGPIDQPFPTQDGLEDKSIRMPELRMNTHPGMCENPITVHPQMCVRMYALPPQKTVTTSLRWDMLLDLSQDGVNMPSGQG